MDTMLALVKDRRGAGLALRSVPVPAAGPGDVVIRVLKTAICGTDVHIYEWDEWAQRALSVPLVAGHEFVGRIVELGEAVQGLEPGQLVTGEGHIVCGRCRNCRAGRRHLCAHSVCIGATAPGAFAEYLLLPAVNVWPADERIPLDTLAIFDPLGNAVHAALSFDLVGEDVLITGAGPVGCLATAVVRHAGARHIVVTDDGSAGRKGLVTAPLQELLQGSPGPIRSVYAIGPGPMMRACAETTRPGGVPTVVSLNTVMVDGTGMCGGCRVRVGGQTLFTCVDGPEFDGHQVDWDTVLSRQKLYLAEERASLAHLCSFDQYTART